jgi:hypothetical protein
LRESREPIGRLKTARFLPCCCVYICCTGQQLDRGQGGSVCQPITCLRVDERDLHCVSRLTYSDVSTGTTLDAKDYTLRSCEQIDGSCCDCECVPAPAFKEGLPLQPGFFSVGPGSLVLLLFFAAWTVSFHARTFRRSHAFLPGREWESDSNKGKRDTYCSDQVIGASSLREGLPNFAGRRSMCDDCRS